MERDLRRLIYISRCKIDEREREAVVGGIIATARQRNLREGLSGALACTGPDFAQVLEGPDDALSALMDDIRRDRGHTDISILSDRPVASRKFAGWSMAYWGRMTYVRHLISAARGDYVSVGHVPEERNALLSFLEAAAAQ